VQVIVIDDNAPDASFCQFATPQTRSVSAMDVGYATTADGVRIAYSVSGAGPPLLFVRGWISNIDLMWQDPPFRAYFEALGERFTVIRFDMRGNGLSQRDVEELSLEAMVRDIEAVMDAVGVSRAVLYGQCFGGPATIAYAAAHPDRVDRLILDGTYADGPRVARPERQRRIVATLRDIPEAGLAFLTHLTHPNPGPSKFRQHDRGGPNLSSETAARLYTLGFNFDVRPLLPSISAPTLVMHRESTRAIPFRLGRELAASIRGARFVPLEGQAHNPWEEYPDSAIAAISEFLGVPLVLTSQPDGVERFLAIMVVDMPPDANPAQASETGREAVGRAISAHGGEQITHAGSDLIAYFPAASDAIECAITVQRELSAAGCSGTRVGVHAGQPVGLGGEPPDAVTGIARQAAAACGASEIVVSGALRDHCAGRGFLFAEHADTAGAGGVPVRLYRVEWRNEG
jgi:pimeloyl-ACP methyl ester carboxylesterase